MKRLAIGLILLLLTLASYKPIYAQALTTVTGTVKDVNNTLYVGGNGYAKLVSTGAVYPISSLGSFATFSIQLDSSNGNQYIFNFCSASYNSPTTVYCFQTPALTLSGSSEDITSTIQTSAAILPLGGGGGGSSRGCVAAGNIGDLQANGGSGCTPAHINDNGTSLKFSEPSTQFNIDNIIYVDGIKYPFTSTGIASAFASLSGSPGLVVIPPQVIINLTSALVISSSYQWLACSGPSSILQYTGSSSIAGIVQVGTSNTGSADILGNGVTNCWITGNSHAQNALLIEGAHHGIFTGNWLRNVTGAGLLVQWSVSSDFSYNRTSSNDGTFTTQPTNGMILNGVNFSHGVYNFTANFDRWEGVSGTGVLLEDVAATWNITGGTSEGNGGWGIQCYTENVGAFQECTQGKLDSVDFESNTLGDIQMAGSYITLINDSAASSASGKPNLRFPAGGIRNVIVGGYYDTITTDASASYNDFYQVVTGAAGTSNGFTDNAGNSTTIDVSIWNGTNEVHYPNHLQDAILYSPLVSPSIQSSGVNNTITYWLNNSGIQEWDWQFDSSNNLELVNNVGAVSAVFYQTPNSIHFSGTLSVSNGIASQALKSGSASNTDLTGTITIAAATTGTYTFSGTYTSAPICTVTPTSNPTSTGVYWASASTTVLTVTIATSGTITFNYTCSGRN